MWNRIAKPKDQRAALAAQLGQLTSRREQLGTDLAAVEAAWSEALASGEDTRPHTGQRRALLAEVADLDSEIGRVQGWLDQVHAQLARERDEATYRQLSEQFSTTGAQLAALTDGYAAAVQATLDAVAAAAADLIARRAHIEQLHAERGVLGERLTQLGAALYGRTEALTVPALAVGASDLDANRLHVHRVHDAVRRQDPALVAEMLGAAARVEATHRALSAR